MNLESFYGNPRVLQLLKRYLDGISDVEELFKKKAKEIDLSQCIIAVLGMQGCGKSSFLNALLFGDIVLPVDADETTCIPAEVSYGKNSTPIATVYFSDGKEKTILLHQPLAWIPLFPPRQAFSRSFACLDSVFPSKAVVGVPGTLSRS